MKYDDEESSSTSYMIRPKPGLFSSGNLVTTIGEEKVDRVLWQVDVGPYPTRLVLSVGPDYHHNNKHQKRGDVVATAVPHFSMLSSSQDDNYYALSIRNHPDADMTWKFIPLPLGWQGARNYRLEMVSSSQQTQPSLALLPSSSTTWKLTMPAESATTINNNNTPDEAVTVEEVATFSQVSRCWSSCMQVDVLSKEFLSDAQTPTAALLLVAVGSLLLDEQRRRYELIASFFCQG